MKQIFLFEKSNVQTKRKYFVYKEMQSLRIFTVYNFFCRNKITRTDYRIFCFQRIRIFPTHTLLHRLSKVHFTYFFSLKIYDHTRIFQHVIRSRGFPNVNFFNHANRLNFKGKRKIGMNN